MRTQRGFALTAGLLAAMLGTSATLAQEEQSQQPPGMMQRPGMMPMMDMMQQMSRMMELCNEMMEARTPAPAAPPVEPQTQP